MKLLKFDELGVFIGLVCVSAFFGFMSPEFFTLRNWGSITTFASVLGILSLGACLLMIAGEFDLSIGSQTALCGMVFALLTVKSGISSHLSFYLVLFLGLGLGFLNGFVTLKTKLPSFITTLGALLIWRGVVLGVSGGFPMTLLEERSGVLNLLGGPISEGFNISVVWWIALTFILTYVLKFTAYGNQLMASGGNPIAARNRGVATHRMKLSAFCLMGVLSALSGMILFSQLKDLSPVAGENFELYAIASSVIGGTLLTGGQGSLIGAFLGTLLMGVIQAGLIQVGVDGYWFRSFVGGLIITSVFLNLILKQMRQRVQGHATSA